MKISNLTQEKFEERENTKLKRQLLRLVETNNPLATAEAEFYVGTGAAYRDSYTKTWLSSEPELVNALKKVLTQ